MSDLATSDAQLGPAMAALNERQRKFVLALFEAPRTHGSLIFAARAAGYGTPTSSRFSLSSMAHSLSNDPKIQAAIAETSQSYLGTLGPHAVRALKKLLSNPKHRDHGRALSIVMDRVAPTQSTAVVKVEHEAGPGMRATAEVLARIAKIAAQIGIDAERLPPLIDANPVNKTDRAA